MSVILFLCVTLFFSLTSVVALHSAFGSHSSCTFPQLHKYIGSVARLYYIHRGYRTSCPSIWLVQLHAAQAQRLHTKHTTHNVMCIIHVIHT